MKKIFAIVVVAMATMVSGINSNAQEVKKDSPWVEVQVVDIPFEAVVHEGVTRNNNPKFWFEFPSIGNVTISEGNAKKFKAREVTIVLVKWENKETGKFKYTTRQKERVKSSTPNVDLNTLF